MSNSLPLHLRLSQFGGFRGGSVSTMVMTGGTSGFGAIAAERLTLSGNARLILGARRPTSVGASIPLDLTELDSVRAFATSVRERLGDTPVDRLVLNAGVVLPDVAGRTVDGFETTFAVNHLAHYLLLRLLLPALADRAIVVLTTSGTHDPANHAGLAPPRHADAELLAHPPERLIWNGEDGLPYLRVLVRLRPSRTEIGVEETHEADRQP
ncbi:MAG: SDR family NAD(P)-dependent oxidoreductase, partial [Luteitalea sp.]|nr:SDR family NAD(P)-dependent oxidoreductase [Luteitalea sp.]